MSKNKIINPNRNKAREIYEDKKGNITLKAISEMLGENLNNIKYWKRQDNWRKDHRGAPKGNKNAIGNKGGSAPEGNINNLINGKFRKYIPKTEKQLLSEYESIGWTDEQLLRLKIRLASARFMTTYEHMTIDEITDSGLKIARMTEKLYKMSGESFELDKELKKAKIKNLQSDSKLKEVKIKEIQKIIENNKGDKSSKGDILNSILMQINSV